VPGQPEAPNVAQLAANVAAAQDVAPTMPPIQGTSGDFVVTQFRGRQHDNGSVSLSFMVYDWLRAMGLRPRVDSVVASLKSNLKQMSVNGAGVAQVSWIPPVYAETSQAHKFPSALFKVREDGLGDPRDLSNWANDKEAYRWQLINSYGYVPATTTIPPSAQLAVIEDNGDMKTTDGHSVKELFDLHDALQRTQDLSLQTFGAAKTVADDMQNQITAIDQQITQTDLSVQAKEQQIKDIEAQLQKAANGGSSMDAQQAQQQIADLKAEIANMLRKIEDMKLQLQALNKQLDRAKLVMTNADYCAQVGVNMYLNRKTLTGGGVNRLNENHFIVMGTDFWPPTKAATPDEVKGTGPISTGQDPTCPIRDWANPRKPDGTVNMAFYKRTAAPVIGSRPDGGGGMQPVLAKNLYGFNEKLMYLFNVLGDASKQGAKETDGQVRLVLTNDTPFWNLSTLEGQYAYQATNGLVTPTTDGGKVEWMIQARDNNANAMGSYFNDQDVPGYVMRDQQNHDTSKWCHMPQFGGGDQFVAGDCPSLVSEWQLRCPIYIPPPPPPTPPVEYWHTPGYTQCELRIHNPDGTVTIQPIHG
jgi:hypothetical protein